MNLPLSGLLASFVLEQGMRRRRADDVAILDGKERSVTKPRFDRRVDLFLAECLPQGIDELGNRRICSRALVGFSRSICYSGIPTIFLPAAGSAVGSPRALTSCSRSMIGATSATSETKT